MSGRIIKLASFTEAILARFGVTDDSHREIFFEAAVEAKAAGVVPRWKLVSQTSGGQTSTTASAPASTRASASTGSASTGSSAPPPPPVAELPAGPAKPLASLSCGEAVEVRRCRCVVARSPPADASLVWPQWFLSVLNTDMYRAVLLQFGVDGAMLTQTDLDDEALKEVGISLKMHRSRILAAVQARGGAGGQAAGWRAATSWTRRRWGRAPTAWCTAR